MPLMTTVQIADLLRVSQDRVRELIQAGELRAQTVGGVWDVDRRQLTSLAKRIGQKSHSRKPDE